MHAAVVVRVVTFRTTRPAFDADLRGSILPAIRRRSGAIGVFAGRQGPDEVGVRLLVSLWATSDAGGEAATTDDLDASSGSLAGTTDLRSQVLPVLYRHLARPPLATGILRLARGRLADIDVGTFAQTLSGHMAALRTGGAGPADILMADAGADSFVMLSTWPDWAAIEAATGASISAPLGTKRFAELSEFEVDHFELLTDVAPAVD